MIYLAWKSLAWTSLVVPLIFVAACGAIRLHRQLDQPIGSQLTTSIGGTIFRLNKLGDLPNAFGGRDIWGGKVDRGFAEMKLVGIEDQTLILDVVDVSRQWSKLQWTATNPSGKQAWLMLTFSSR